LGWGRVLVRLLKSRDDALGENAMRKLENPTMIEIRRKDRAPD
jgi:hypothetical protein